MNSKYFNLDLFHFNRFHYPHIAIFHIELMDFTGNNSYTVLFGSQLHRFLQKHSHPGIHGPNRFEPDQTGPENNRNLGPERSRKNSDWSVLGPGGP